MTYEQRIRDAMHQGSFQSHLTIPAFNVAKDKPGRVITSQIRTVKVLDTGGFDTELSQGEGCTVLITDVCERIFFYGFGNQHSANSLMKRVNYLRSIQ